MWYYTFYAGLLSVLGALAFQAVRLLAGVVVYRRAAATEIGTVSMAARGDEPVWAGRLATFLTRMGVAFLLLSLVFRVIATQRPPYTNMWEYLVSFGAISLAFYAIFERRYRHPALGAVALTTVAALLVVPEIAFTSAIMPLVPALQNNRLLAIHVALMLVSYSALAVAFSGSVLFLAQGGRDRFGSMPTRAVLDDVIYRAVLIGFPTMALGIALGAYWGSLAWGRYWGWDPKETTALVTWLVFAGYMHTRGLAKWRGTRSAVLVLIGFGLIIFNIFVVNFWIKGLHSYA